MTSKEHWLITSFIRRVAPITLLLALCIGATAENTVTTVSAADYFGIVAPGSLASAFGSALAASTATASSIPLPTTLAGVQVSIKDSANNTVMAPLVYVSPTQINYLVPTTVALGAAKVTVMSGSANLEGTLLVSNVAPALFSANSSGKGAPVGQVVVVDSTGHQTTADPFQGMPGSYTPNPFSVTSGTVYLVLYGTGIRSHSPNPVIATIKGMGVPIAFVGAQATFVGLDQINIGPLPASLAGAGATNLVVTVDGIPANALQVAIQ